MELLNVQSVEKTFVNHKALDKVDLVVPENTIYGLLGPNGAGKTTLIRIINRITAPDSGLVEFQGKPMRNFDIHNIGYLPEERGLYKKMKVGEQSLYLAQLKGLPKREALKRLKRWFEKFEMEAWWDKKVEELSKGMQQKIQFIATVVHEPSLLIFDEPFSGFDPINANLLKKEILELKKNGATIIFSTHNMGSVEELCDHITLINKSKNILEGPIDKVRERYRSHIYEVAFKGNPTEVAAKLNTSYEITYELPGQEQHIVRVKGNEGGKANELLNNLLPISEIVSFKELIPSMNDIFIQVVQNNK
ncbi:MAG: ATP-binding cassette domain-containing protein [Bacteroidales bacterium]|jgi:ABC-2 type transport system ATP-binding protein